MDKLKIDVTPLIEKVTGRVHSQPPMPAPVVIIGPVVGALIGAGTALLLAPQSGKRTQTILHREGNRLKQEVGRSLQDLQTNITHAADDTRERISELQQTGLSFLSSRASTVQDTLANARNTIGPVQSTTPRNLITMTVPLVALLAAVAMLRAKGA